MNAINEDAAGALIPRATIESIVALRNDALARYDAAYAARDAVKAAHAAGQAASPGITSYNHCSDRHRRNFLYSLDLAHKDQFTAAARRLTDIDVWAHIIQMTHLESVMDKTAKDQLRAELDDDPPEVTVGNVHATLERFALDADMIWKRGVATCFSKLDRRFRSHGGWKICSRVILNHAFDDWGHWSHYSNHRDTLIDIERAFHVLDGRRPPEHYSGILHAIDEARHGWGARQSVVESEFFKICIYKNGNCHLWFRRDDLVRKVNKLLAEYYGEVIPEERGPDPEDPLRTPKTTIARNYGHFPTPDGPAEDVINHANLHRAADQPPLAVLEPSAGAGNLARRAAEKGCLVDCVEIQPHLANALQQSGLYRRVTQADFIGLPPRPVYDRVIMNPPFDLERDIDHVVHAMEFLNPEGLLVAIMSAGTEFRETRKARAFRDRMATLNARWTDLPMGAFAPVGTNVNTPIVHVAKDGRVIPIW